MGGAGMELRAQITMDSEGSNSMEEDSNSGVTWRITFSIISSMVWLIFIIAWIGFGWSDFEVGENIAVMCIASVIYLGGNALVWTIWPRNRSKSSEELD